MVRTLTAIATLTLLVGMFGAASIPAQAVDPSNPSPRSDGAMAFGMDSRSIGKQSAAGVKPDYGTIWVGPWVLKDGWYHTDRQLDNMRAKGVTPAIHLYYWGDDISKDCIENGCWSSLHGTWKDRSGWARLTRELVDHLHARMGGEPVVIFVETEFNKNDVQYYEPLDYYLKKRINYLKWNYPSAHVNLALGNWNSGAWYTWDRAGGAAHSIGIQGMRGSTRDSYTSYMTLYESTLSGAKKAKQVFGKPIVITDIALSSHWEPDYLGPQGKSLQKFFNGMGDLKAAGVKAMFYRSWQDDPTMNLANYYGQAERHWGLVWAGSSAQKPAGQAWVEGVKAERGGSSGSTGGTYTDSGSFTASFAPSSSVNEWWVDVKVKASQPVSKVQIKVDGGTWTGLPKSDWGTYAKSMHVPKGSSVLFRAVSTSSEVAKSDTYTWLGGSSSSGTSSFSATFDPKSQGNDWWVETGVKGTSGVAKVEVRVNGGSWTTLPKTDWGTYAKSIHAPNGATVLFRATSSSGEIDKSGTYTWW